MDTEIISKDKRDLVITKESYDRIRTAILEAIKSEDLIDKVSVELLDAINVLTKESKFTGDGSYCLECGKQYDHENHTPTNERTHLYRSSVVLFNKGLK